MKIVVRGANWIGDAMMSIPALREIRRIFPEAHITMHTRSWAEGIFRDADFIDSILSFDRSGSSLKTLFSQARVWRAHRFDLAILFPNSFESALLARFGRVPKRFGYAKEARGFLLTEAFRVPAWKKERHEIFYYLNLVAEIEKKVSGSATVSTDTPLFELNVSRKRKDGARKLLTQLGADPSRKTVLFVPGSTNSRAKRWQAEGFASLNDRLRAELAANVILLGASDELDVSLRIAELSKHKPVILTGKTNLSDLTALISICDLLVSNDTGPAHISAALGTKTLVIFGPTNPNTTRPWKSEIIRRDLDCSPCMRRDCPIDHRCMTRISADEVFDKAVSMI